MPNNAFDLRIASHGYVNTVQSNPVDRTLLSKLAYYLRTKSLLLCMLSIFITSCDGGSPGNPDNPLADAAMIPTEPPLDDQLGNTGIFTTDTTVRELGGTAPLNITRYAPTERNDNLAGHQFIDANGVVVEFVGQSAESLDKLKIAEGIQVEGFEDSMLSTNGFISVVYPDDYDIRKIVRITTSDLAQFTVYWPGEKLIETLPASRTDDNALEVHLPEKYKQLVFAMVIAGALGR